MQDLLAEQIDFMIEPSSNFKSLVGAGSVKPYAITDRARPPSSPDIPTADEAGLPGFFASLWYGLWVPKDTPKDIRGGADYSTASRICRCRRTPGRGGSRGR